VPIRDFLVLAPEDGDVVGVFSLEEEPVIMLGTKSGVVKRVALQGLQDRTVTPVIALKEGDTVRGVGLSPDDSHIVFITDAAQLLHYPASAVRAQGLPAAGMTGISLPAGVSVVWSGTADPGSAEVITLSGSRSVLPGTEALRIKQTPLSEFPTKGRATAGVRAHSFLKGEDLLLQAFVGTRPLLMGSRGTPVEVNLEPAKRDASGGPLDSAVETIGEALS
jgi:DNA gyrase subunit A